MKFNYLLLVLFLCYLFVNSDAQDEITEKEKASTLYLMLLSSDLRSELCNTRSCRCLDAFSRTQSMNRSKSDI